MKQSDPGARSRTSWIVVLAAFIAGAIGAGHIGKVPAALPAIRAELGLGLVLAGWVVSAFSITGMTLGTVAGVISDRFGHRRICVIGTVLVAVGSAAGAFAADGVTLLTARFVEGVGFLLVVVAAPSIISQAASTEDRRFAVAMWGAFMPAGMAVILLVAPVLLDGVGWRGTWLVMAGVSLVWALVMLATFGRGQRRRSTAEPGAAWRNLVVTVSAGRPWLLALAFSFYTLSWLALMVWLPTYAVEERGLSVRTGAYLTLIAVTINFPGNLVGAWLLNKCLKWGQSIMLGASAMLICGPLIFLDVLPDLPRYAMVLLYSFLSGLVPAGVLGAVPYFAPSPSQIGTTNGLIIQGSHLGQFLGPPILALAVSLTGGWQAGAWVFGVCGVGAVCFAAAIWRAEARMGAAAKS